MKVTKDTSRFDPITITIESRHELDVLYAVTARISGNCPPIRKVTNQLFEKLEELGASGDAFKFIKTGMATEK